MATTSGNNGIVSRYDTPGAQTAAGLSVNRNGGTVNQSGSSSGNTTGSTQTQGTTSGSTTSRQVSNNTTNTQNMTGSSLAALETLIAQLLGGGNQESANMRAQRLAQIQTETANQSNYGKDNAFADAQGLMAQTMRQTLEKLLPTINRAAEGAGTSQSSMRALLTQKAAQDAAEAASAQGLNAAVQYGQVNSAFGSILERLTQPDNTVTQNLLAALQTARGAVTSSTSSGETNTTGTSDSNTSSSSTNQSTTNNNNNSSTNTAVGSGGGTSGGTSRLGPSSDGLVHFGGSQNYNGTAGTTSDLLAELAGNRQSPVWSDGFTF